MPLDNTLVTIIIPIYNHQTYVKECIESILTQDYPRIELIVVDDGSTDSSFEVAKGLESTISDRCCNYQIIRKENGGMSSALNYGLRYASGEYIIPIASDDDVTANFSSDKNLLAFCDRYFSKRLSAN